MAILAECPMCRKKQATKNRLCSCGEDLIKAKRSKRVKYWIAYRLPGGKQRRELCDDPYSIETARTQEGKRRTQKYENPRILEQVPDERITFGELAKWYLDLKPVRNLRSYDRVVGCLASFNRVFGSRIVGTIKPVDLEDYQEQRHEQGRAPATIDMELIYAKAMVSKAFDNDMVSGHTLKAFRGFKRKLRKGVNARRRTLSFQEYARFVAVALPHLRAMTIVAYNTGMRTGELRKLQWKHIDWKKGFIRLQADVTKEGRAKSIPMNGNVRQVLEGLPHAIHHDFVFTYNGEPITDAGGLKRSFKKACQNAGIPRGMKTPGGLIFHDIRRTVKTNMLNAGVDKIHRDIILGHSLMGMDAHYMAPSEADLHRAMDKYTAWLDKNLASVDQNVDQEAQEG